VSDEKKSPNPDDFSKTVPNISKPKTEGPADWEKTNYGGRFSAPPAEEWGKTVTNIKPIGGGHESNKAPAPGQPAPKVPEWGLTEQNVKLPGEPPPTGGHISEPVYGATAPFINLPEADRNKYLNIPPTPGESTAKNSQEKNSKGGIPTWFWIASGLTVVFFFVVFVIAAVWLFFIRATDFEVELASIPPDARVLVDNTEWSLSDSKGTRLITGLRAGEAKVIKIEHPNYSCEDIKVTGKAGEVRKIVAKCAQRNAPVNDECLKIGLGEFEKAERCANIALDRLPSPFTGEQLTQALNIFIINFESGKSSIPSKQLEFMRRASEFVKRLPASTVLEVGGHTDDKGNDSSNLTLSDNRAKEVKRVLMEFGVSPGTLQIKGYGEANPKVPNSDDLNRFYNRRIEYKVLKQ
jgi:outer membrane protein OmpA-like peptidoglycan-associated protein